MMNAASETEKGIGEIRRDADTRAMENWFVTKTVHVSLENKP